MLSVVHQLIKRKSSIGRLLKNTLFSTLSTLTFLAWTTKDLSAQTLNTSCAQNLQIGEHVACSIGTLRIRPNGTTVITGCLAVLTVPQAGQCTVSVTGGAATRDVIVDFPTQPVNISFGGNNVSMNNFRLEKTATTGTAATITLTTAEITAPVVFDVGATASFGDNQAAGTYTGGVTIRARFN